MIVILGSSHTDVTFKYIIFRPEIGSLITGKIKSCTRDGIFVTLGFFDDIFIHKGNASVIILLIKVTSH